MSKRNSFDLALSLVTGALREGGHTAHVVAGADLPTSGFFVGGRASVALPVGSVQDYDVESWVSRVLPTVETSEYLGAWIDAGLLWLDVSVHVDDASAALLLAHERRELAVWDIAHGESVTV